MQHRATVAATVERGSLRSWHCVTRQLYDHYMPLLLLVWILILASLLFSFCFTTDRNKYDGPRASLRMIGTPSNWHFIFTMTEDSVNCKGPTLQACFSLCHIFIVGVGSHMRKSVKVKLRINKNQRKARSESLIHVAINGQLEDKVAMLPTSAAVSCNSATHY